MPPFASVFAMLSISLTGNYQGNLPEHLEVGIKSTPGVHCRAIGLAMVYGEANLASRILGRTQSFIAVTGKEVNGFLPIVTGVGIKGWVVANQVYPENGELGPCKVQVLPDGKLLFGWS